MFFFVKHVTLCRRTAVGLYKYIIVSNYTVVAGMCTVTCLTAQNMDNFK